MQPKACYGKAAANRVTKLERLGHLWLVGAHPWHQTVATSLQTVSRRDIPVLLLGQLAMPELQSATWPPRGGRRREAPAGEKSREWILSAAAVRTRDCCQAGKSRTACCGSKDTSGLVTCVARIQLPRELCVIHASVHAAGLV